MPSPSYVVRPRVSAEAAVVVAVIPVRDAVAVDIVARVQAVRATTVVVGVAPVRDAVAIDVVARVYVVRPLVHRSGVVVHRRMNGDRGRARSDGHRPLHVIARLCGPGTEGSRESQ